MNTATLLGMNRAFLKAPAMPNQSHNQSSAASKFFDMKIPLVWLLGVAGLLCVLIWNAAGRTQDLTNKIDLLINTNSKLERRFDDRDAKIEVMNDKINDIRRDGLLNTQRINALENPRK